MTQSLLDMFSENPGVQLTDHVADSGAIWLPHPAYNGTLRVKSGGPNVCAPNNLDVREALNFANVLMPSSSVLALNGEFVAVGLTDTKPTGTVTLTGGASGSVNTITVNGVNILPAPVPFNTSLIQTATDVAVAISFGTPRIPWWTTNGVAFATADNVGGTSATITIFLSQGWGTSQNGVVVNATTTTITFSKANISGGATGIQPDSTIGVCYAVDPAAASFYRLRINSAGFLVLEKVANRAITVLATSTRYLTATSFNPYLFSIYVFNGVHLVVVTSPSGGFGYDVLIGADSALSLTNYVGVWSSNGGTVSGSAPNQTAGRGANLGAAVSFGSLAFSAGVVDTPMLTLPAMNVASILGLTAFTTSSATGSGGAQVGGTASIDFVAKIPPAT